MRVRFHILIALAALGAPTAAHVVLPAQIDLRPGGKDYIYVVDQGSCPASITATVADPLLVSVRAVNMFNGNLLPGNGATATVPNRVDQVFEITALADPAGPLSTSVEICWVGVDYGGVGPCQENNCSPYAPATVAITVRADPESAGSNFLSGIARDPVHLASASLFFTEPSDFDLGGPQPVTFRRTYSSRLAADGAPVSSLGTNWRHNHDWQLVSVGNNVEIWTDEGRLIRFEKGFFDTAWSLTPYEDVAFQLVESGATWVLGDPRSGLVRTFDGAGRLTLVEDGRGNAHALTYANGRLDQVSDGLGRMLSCAYGGLGQLTGVSDGTRAVSFGYDASQRLQSATDTKAKTTTYAYDAAFPGDALMTARTRPNGNAPVTQTWDGSGRVATQTDADGNTWSFAYDAPSDSATVSGPGGGSVVHDHDGEGRLTDWTDEAGNAATMTYDASGRRGAVTDSLGGTTSTSFDPVGGQAAQVTESDGTRVTRTFGTRTFKGIALRQLTSIVRPDGTRVDHTYDASGNLLTTVGPDGATWTSTYNGFGQVTSVLNPQGGTTSIAYNADGTVASITDPSGDQTTFGYDALRRLSLVTFDDGGTASYTSDDRDQLLTATDALGRTWGWSYDDNGNLTTATDPAGATTKYCLDSMDRLAAVIDALGNVTAASFGSNGRVETLTDANGNATSYAYDAVQRLQSVSNPLGKTWSAAYDDEGVPTARTTPLGTTETFVTDSRGRVTRRASPSCAAVMLHWSAANQLLSRENTAGETTTFGYGPNGLVDDIRAPVKGMRTTLGYNGLGQLNQLQGPGGSTWSWNFGLQGEMLSYTDPLARRIDYSFDSDNNPQMASLAGLGTLSYSFDAGNRPTSIDFSDGLSVGYSWDLNDRLTSSLNLSAAYDARGAMTDSNGLAIGRDPIGLILSVTYAPGKTVTYDYWEDNRVKSVVDWVGGTTDFQYDDNGRLISTNRPNGLSTIYTYDQDGALDWLAHRGLADLNIARNAAGQIVSETGFWPLEGTPAVAPKETWSFDAAYQTVGHQWDALGRWGGDGMRSATWNLAGWMTDYDDGNSSRQYQYDALGSPTARTEGGLTVGYTWNYATKLPSLAVEYTGGVDRTYNVFTPDGLLLHSIDAATDQRSFFHLDQSYSTRFLTDDGGSVTAAWDYSPTGQVTAASGSASTGFLWRGGYGLRTDGDLHFWSGRWFDSMTGRYLSAYGRTSISPLTINGYTMDGGNPNAFGDRVRSTLDHTGHGGSLPDALAYTFRRETLQPVRRLVANEIRPLPGAIRDLVRARSFLGYPAFEEPESPNRRRAIAKFREAIDILEFLSFFGDQPWYEFEELPLAPRAPELPVADSFDWEQITPRLGFTYALGAERKTLLRASYSNYTQAHGSGVAATVGDVAALGDLGYFDFDPLRSDLASGVVLDGLMVDPLGHFAALLVGEPDLGLESFYREDENLFDNPGSPLQFRIGGRVVFD